MKIEIENKNFENLQFVCEAIFYSLFRRDVFKTPVKPRMFYLIGSRKNICSIALTLLLLAVVLFLTLISTIYDSKIL